MKGESVPASRFDSVKLLSKTMDNGSYWRLSSESTILRFFHKNHGQIAQESTLIHRVH